MRKTRCPRLTTATHSTTLALLVLFLPLATPTSRAQVPASIAGAAIETIITNGIAPFSSNGAFLFLPANADEYQTVGIYNVSNSGGVYLYSVLSTNTARINANDAAEGFWTEDLTFETAVSGTYLRTAQSGGAQSGTFEVRSGQAPTSLSGKSLYCFIDYGRPPFSASGSFTINTSPFADTFGYGTNTGPGHYSYTAINTATAKIETETNEAIYLTFSDPGAGGFARVSTATDGFQAGRFQVAERPTFTRLKGAYNGPLWATNQASPMSAGFVTLNLAANAAFTGVLQYGPNRYSLSGRFDSTGYARKVIKRGKLEPMNLDLQIDFFPGFSRITGTVSAGSLSGRFVALPAGFTGKGQSIAPQAGKYTMAFLGATNANLPAGDGYATLTIDKAGRTRLTAALADGSKFTQAATLSQRGDLPLYAPLYGGQGSISSWLFVAAPPTNALTGNVLWVKPGTVRTKYYNAGFESACSAVGSRLTAPAKGVSLLDLTNTVIRLAGADLSGAVTNELATGPLNRLTASAPNKVNLTFSPATGIFKGTVRTPGTPRPTTFSFSGVVLQNQGQARGFLLGPTQSGKVIIGSPSDLTSPDAATPAIPVASTNPPEGNMTWGCSASVSQVVGLPPGLGIYNGPPIVNPVINPPTYQSGVLPP